LHSSSFPLNWSLKNIAQISSHSSWLNRIIFTVFCISTLA
jgi:hypothetical protein